MKILVVDDMLFNRIFIAKILEKLGHTCILKNNGQEAVDFLELNAVDAIILDIEMPKMNGLEAASYIKNNLALKTPIAAITSHNSSEYDKKIQDSGFDFVLIKPVCDENIAEFLKDIPVI